MLLRGKTWAQVWASSPFAILHVNNLAQARADHKIVREVEGEVKWFYHRTMKKVGMVWLFS